MNELALAVNKVAPRVYQGSFVDALYRCIADGNMPATTHQIAEAHLNGTMDWKDHWHTTIDAIVNVGDEIKIVPNCQVLLETPKDTPFADGIFHLTEGQYRRLPGKTFQRSELVLKTSLTKAQALEHPVWQALLGKTLDAYVDAVFMLRKKDNGETKAMGVFIGDYQSGAPLELYDLGDGNSLNDAGHCGILWSGTRLVGVQNADVKEFSDWLKDIGCRGDERHRLVLNYIRQKGLGSD